MRTPRTGGQLRLSACACKNPPREYCSLARNLPEHQSAQGLPFPLSGGNMHVGLLVSRRSCRIYQPNTRPDHQSSQGGGGGGGGVSMNASIVRANTATTSCAEDSKTTTSHRGRLAARCTERAGAGKGRGSGRSRP